MDSIPLILIPGMLCDHRLWQHQISALSPVGTVTVTDKHMHHPTIARIADAIVDGAPPRFALAGLSMGGYIALEICRKYNHRVDRLALIDTSARIDTTEQADRRECLIALCQQGKFSDVIDLLYSLFVDLSRLADAALRRHVVDMALRVGPEAFIRQQRAISGRIDQRPSLPAIDCPTVVVCGAADRITPVDCAEEIAANIPGAALEIIPGCGHLSTMEKPEVVSGILYRWLTAA